MSEKLMLLLYLLKEKEVNEKQLKLDEDKMNFNVEKN